MSPTEQARGDSGKEPKLPLRQNGEKNLGRNQAQLHFYLQLAKKRDLTQTESQKLLNAHEKYSKLMQY